MLKLPKFCKTKRKKVEKISVIIESIANEKNLKIQDVQERVKLAFIKTAEKLYGRQFQYGAKIVDSKTILLYQKVDVVDNHDERLKEENEFYISIDEAKKIDKNVEISDELTYEIPFESLGHTAINMLQKELQFHIQRLEEEKIFEKYQNMINKIVHGNVVMVDDEENTHIELDETRGILSRKNRIKGESFKIGDVVNCIIKKVFIDKYQGILIELSRTSPKFLEALLELEVPEIKEGSVVINASARIPGERAKIALTSLHPSVDAVGSTVGQKGIRINAVGKELKNESIDCIEYSNIPEIYITRALNPAIIKKVIIKDKKAIVQLAMEQKSKAIGKNGINIRLASMLTGYVIELDTNVTSDFKSSNDALKDLKALFKE